MKADAHPQPPSLPISSTSGIGSGRAPFRIPLIFRWMGRWCDGSTRDLGVGGTFIESRQAPVQGSTIEIVLEIDPARRPLHLEAVVRWHEDAGFGVQFLLLGAYETHVLACVLGER